MRGGRLYPIDFARVDPQQVLLSSLIKTGIIEEKGRATADYHLVLKE
jgi:hypothetical protein